MIILVDMDGVIADFEQGFLDKYRMNYPTLPFIPLEQRTNFFLTDDYPESLRTIVEETCWAEGFFYDLPLIQGSLEGLAELSKKSDVYICTSPLLENPTCVQEKYDWINKYLGTEWTKRMILTMDKTLIEGDILIDDKPVIEGISDPEWEHILYAQPYNSKEYDKLRITWGDWKEAFERYLL